MINCLIFQLNCLSKLKHFIIHIFLDAKYSFSFVIAISTLDFLILSFTTKKAYFLHNFITICVHYHYHTLDKLTVSFQTGINSYKNRSCHAHDKIIIPFINCDHPSAHLMENVLMYYRLYRYLKV